VTLDERAALVDEMREKGFCAHYPGYACNRDFLSNPAACRACIASWIMRMGVKKRDDPRIVEIFRHREEKSKGITGG
jgi:hypothetical protein